MLARRFKPSETREYSVILNRTNKGKYALSEIGEKDRKTVSGYIDTLMSDSELIPTGADRVLVNLKETEETLFCEVTTLSKN
jgi:hypothetical protein